MKSDRTPPNSNLEQTLSLSAGGPPVLVRFVDDEPGNSLAAFPTLRLEGRPYDQWLSERVFGPFLEHYLGTGGNRRAVTGEVDAGNDRCRKAFAEILPLAVAAGTSAVLAVLAITARLQRTLTHLGIMLLDERAAGAAILELSRAGCGFVSDPGLRSALGKRPVRHLRTDRRDLRELAAALDSSPAAVATEAATAIEILRREICGSGLYSADDLHHLLSHHRSTPDPTGFRRTDPESSD